MICLLFKDHILHGVMSQDGCVNKDSCFICSKDEVPSLKATRNAKKSTGFAAIVVNIGITCLASVL